MKHLCILALIAGLLVLVGAGLLQSAPPQKATGGVSFATTGSGGEKLQRWIEFEAHAGHNGQLAKGWVKYHNSNGLRFRADVQCVNIVDDRHISGPIVTAPDTLFLSRWFLFVVYDGGTPGSQGDKIFYQIHTTDPGCSPAQPPYMHDVESGNLVVH